MFALVFLLDSFLPHWLVRKTKVLSSALIFVLYELQMDVEDSERSVVFIYL